MPFPTLLVIALLPPGGGPDAKTTGQLDPAGPVRPPPERMPGHGGALADLSDGIRGRTGTREAPGFLNVASAFDPQTSWDRRAASLEELLPE